MINLFKYILLFIIIYLVMKFLQKIFRKISSMNQHVKGQSKYSKKKENYNNIEDADFEEIE